MSKRAKERALEAYPPTYSRRKRYAKRVQSELVDTHQSARALFQKGYEQAEEDLALTWEDIQIIWIEIERYMKELRQIEQTDLSKFPSSSMEIFEEVLRRFNEYKSKKNESE